MARQCCVWIECPFPLVIFHAVGLVSKACTSFSRDAICSNSRLCRSLFLFARPRTSFPPSVPPTTVSIESVVSFFLLLLLLLLLLLSKCCILNCNLRASRPMGRPACDRMHPHIYWSMTHIHGSHKHQKTTSDRAKKIVCRNSRGKQNPHLTKPSLNPKIGKRQVAFPFSLINSPEQGNMEGVSPSLNHLRPGWVLAESMYMVIRNEQKYGARKKAR